MSCIYSNTILKGAYERQDYYIKKTSKTKKYKIGILNFKRCKIMSLSFITSL